MPKLQLHRRRDRAVAEIAARLGAIARGQRVGEEFRGEFHHVVAASCGAARAARHRGSPPAAARPAIDGEPFDGLGETDALGLHQEVEMMSPCLPEEKS